MNNLILRTARLAGRDGNVDLLIEDKLIKEIKLTNADSSVSGETIIADTLVTPGFIDIHNHGAIGVDVNTATADDLHRVSRFLASQGVTAWLPTFVPDADENYQKVIEAIDDLMETQAEREPAARILGVHYEGVFANEKMCGALRPQFFKTFKNGDEIAQIPRLKDPNAIHLMTLAPEIENGIELIRELKKQNWNISIGHTRADINTLDLAFEAGATQITHLFNAMTGVHHRDIGVAGWALMNEKVFCEIIADGHHVAPEMLRFAYQNKTADKLMLISDSVAPTGLGDGNFELWNEKISVINGKTQNERGSIAGSVITMLDAFRLYQSLGISANEIAKMASLNQAKVLGLDNLYGSIEQGKHADLVGLDEKGTVKFTLVGGRLAFGKL